MDTPFALSRPAAAAPSLTLALAAAAETSATAPSVRIRVYLSNGRELVGPTLRSDLAAGASREVELDAAGRQFERRSAHLELGDGEN